jgi:hypothetical protein
MLLDSGTNIAFSRNPLPPIRNLSFGAFPRDGKGPWWSDERGGSTVQGLFGGSSPETLPKLPASYLVLHFAPFETIRPGSKQAVCTRRPVSSWHLGDKMSFDLERRNTACSLGETKGISVPSSPRFALRLCLGMMDRTQSIVAQSM